MGLTNQTLDIIKNRSGKKVVFTNGCFDLVHRGHIAYLNEARALGDILILGLNSDSSVRGLKGPERPINNEDDRKFLLENLKAVDSVEIFSDETPIELIKSIMPDILVKGGDWQKEQIVGYDIVEANGGTVQSLSFIDGYSSTNLIEKIRK
ncbi:MAG: D-glycero-beta-D-manno-heptose 1-phosphate adenylyltransferase [Bacteriovoracaceae bacterium]